MDNYLDKKRFNSYYLTLALDEAENLRITAQRASSRHLQDLFTRMNFNNEIEKFISSQLQGVKEAENEHECESCLYNLKEERGFIYQQDNDLGMHRAQVVVSAELVNKLDTWGYIINGVSVVLSGFQIAAGMGMIAASMTHANFIGISTGALLILHGINGGIEGLFNIVKNRSDTIGPVKKTYVQVANFMGYSDSVGLIAYSTMDISLSFYGLARHVIKPDSFRIYRYLPSDFVRNYKTMSNNALMLEAVGDGFAIKSMIDSRN